MNRFDPHRLTLLLLTHALLAGPAMGQADLFRDPPATTTANSPITISGDPDPSDSAGAASASPETGEESEAEAVEPSPADGTVSAGIGENSTESVELTPVELVAPQESLAIGESNGMLSARPVGDGDDADSGGVLAAIDPRTNGLTKVLGALAAVVGLLFLLRVMFKRSGGMLAGGMRPSGVLEILARYPVGRGQSLVILRMARRVLLVHQAGGAMTTLSEITDPDEVANLLGRMESGSKSRDAHRFRSALQHFESEHDRMQKLGFTGESSNVEMVDLTRSQGRGLSALLSGRRTVA